MKRTVFLILGLAWALIPAGGQAQAPPAYVLDATWPRPLPEKWITGQLGGVCSDAHDHIAVVNRRDITDEEKETGEQAPPILVFDRDGALVASFGDPEKVPDSIHGCAFDRDNNIYVAGNGDGIIQKYSHDGRLLLQIGTRGKFDTSDGTEKGTFLNKSPNQFFNPSGMVIDPANGDIYISDGYGNKRVAVFDRDGKFLRQWGRKATVEETRAGAPGVFSNVVHCIAMSNAGLVYVCDRQGDRVQVFDKQGKFVRNVWIRTGTPTLPDARGTAWWVAFSRDPQQRHMYVMNGRNETVHVLDHESGKILSTFGRPGHQAGSFTHGHTIAVDSAGNIYVAETSWGRRVQKFRPAPPVRSTK
jgi:DNA-binding beta-propeller fold protein YncE